MSAAAKKGKRRVAGRIAKRSLHFTRAAKVRKAAAKVASTGRTLKRPASALAADATSSGLEAWEGRLWAEGCRIVAGTDEAGRGPWAGPVVAAAFAVLSPEEDEEVFELVRSVADSKKMTALQREKAYEQLTDRRFKGRIAWAVAEASAKEIDTTDILQAALQAMARSVHGLNLKPDCVLVDGCNRPPALLRPGECWTRGSSKSNALPAGGKKHCLERFRWRPRRVEAVIGGDARVPSISAASVIAKVHRDRLMEKMDKKYPKYGFGSHKGYGTAVHMAAIKRHGVCREHRQSFAPIQAAMVRKRPAAALRR